MPGVDLIILSSPELSFIRSFLNEHIYPRATKYIYSEFAVVTSELYKHAVPLSQGYRGPISSATAGRMFWNVAHTDADLGLTILAALGSVSDGGSFAHPSVGVAHSIRPGCLLIVNPAKLHCTAEFKVGEGDPGRTMVAFFTKESVVLGAGTAGAAARRLKMTGSWECKRRRR